ncbi:hypothetical protein SBA3_1380008 [Candidatus Sulfopaludibacter sp. SbA3]|nr:hypothetical protein SBA3_1380008 [Candidatus Sulfopaludibacter sp. SbA3]
MPAEGIATFLIPSSTHMEMAQESPRALKDAVGFMPSSLTHRASAPTRAPSRLVRIRGVHPSPRDVMALSAGGSTGEYRHMLEVPLGTSRLNQRCRILSRSYRTNKGPPQLQRLAICPASNRVPHRLHSKCVALLMKYKV